MHTPCGEASPGFCHCCCMAAPGDHSSNCIPAEDSHAQTLRWHTQHERGTRPILPLHVELSRFVKLQKFRSLWPAVAFFPSSSFPASVVFVLVVFVCFQLVCIVTVGIAFQLRRYCYVWDGEQWVVAELTALLNGNAGVWMETTAEPLYTQFIVPLLVLLELMRSQIEKEYITSTR